MSSEECYATEILIIAPELGEIDENAAINTYRQFKKAFNDSDASAAALMKYAQEYEDASEYIVEKTQLSG